MNDEELQMLAAQQDVVYLPEILQKDVYVPALEWEPKMLSDVSHAINRALLLEYGAVFVYDHILRTRRALAIDPRVNPLEKKVGDRTLRDFLCTRFIGKTDAVPDSRWMYYAPQETIDCAIVGVVPDYLERKAKQQEYQRRMQELSNQAYHDLLAFRKGEKELSMPTVVREMLVRCERDEGRRLLQRHIHFNGALNIPLWYDKDVWPTTLWLSSFTSMVSNLYSIFADYDNVLPGNHIEQRIAFDDVAVLTRHTVEMSIIQYVAGHREIRRRTLPRWLARSATDWSRAMNHLKRQEKETATPLYLLVSDAVMQQFLNAAKRHHSKYLPELRSLRARPEAQQLMRARLPPHLSPDLLDPALAAKRREAEQIIKQLWRREGFGYLVS